MIPKQANQFLKDLTGRSLDTIENYTSFANVFWTYIDKPLEEISVRDIMQFLKWGTDKRKWKLSTMVQNAKVAQRFMSEFKDDDFMKELKKQVRMLPKTRMHAGLYEGVYIPGDRIDDFIDAAPDEEHAVCYTMILKWGARLMEALNQRLDDINPKLTRVTVRGKGAGFERKARPVWVDRKSLHRVLAFVGCNSNQIIGSQPIKRKGKILNLKPRDVQRAWKKTAKKIGLPHWKKLTPHDGRHSYAIDYLNRRKGEGMRALESLRRQLGHTNINTTKIYLDFSEGESKDIFMSGLNEDER